MYRYALLAALLAPPAFAAPCGGDFRGFLATIRAEAIAAGHPAATVDAFLKGIRHDPAVIRADRAQGVFQLDFLTFSRRLISQNRMDSGRANMTRYAAIFDRVERDYGVPRGILTAFWAFETDFGQNQGAFNTANALATLSHDCRRPDLFQPQLLAAIKLFAKDDFDPATTTGAWAGEIGMVQMLPEDIIRNGVDGDGDGHVRLKTSVADALMSGGKMLQSLGWRRGEPWLHEVTIPATLDLTRTGTHRTETVRAWAQTGVAAREGNLGPAGIEASLILPMGRKGPAFLAYPNFRVLFEWNQSFTYVLTAAYFATRLEGAPVYRAGEPEPGLDEAGMKDLQTRLAALGHEVGRVDGILGANTRAAVQKEQARLGLPADGWPTAELLRRLR